MSNTYTQIHIQFVFAVKFRKAQLLPSFKDELLKYITAVIQNDGHKLLSINSEPDHIHIFIGMRPTQSISDLMKEVKANSSRWINERGFLPTRFEWQGGYGAFSYRKRDVKGVIDYINKQEIHHLKTTFIEEYIEFLKEFEIDYEEQFIFKEMI
ncbi:MAG: IS200/IS605 family transposase [Bacteroidetes bacterium]|nr:IS200/IS605 family transposase [Bacteroidota bacterium]MBK8586044.1 IS200/IS605 family transposase [Bacteroidota bacterium]